MDETHHQQTQKVIVKYNEEEHLGSSPYLLSDKSNALSLLIPNISNEITQDSPTLSTVPFPPPSIDHQSHTTQGIQPEIGWDHNNDTLNSISVPEPFLEISTDTTTLLNIPVRKRVNVLYPYCSKF